MLKQIVATSVYDKSSYTIPHTIVQISEKYQSVLAWFKFALMFSQNKLDLRKLKSNEHTQF